MWLAVITTVLSLMARSFGRSLDYVLIALKGKGTLTIADAPLIDNDFERIVKRTGLDEMVTYFSSAV